MERFRKRCLTTAGINAIKHGDYLRNRFPQLVRELLHNLRDGFCRYHIHHNFLKMGGFPQHQKAQNPFVGSQMVHRQTGAFKKLATKFQHRIQRFGLQPAIFNIQNPVEIARNVKAQGKIFFDFRIF